MRKVGDYEWNQVSVWDFTPAKCIEKFVKSDDGKHIFHYYLMRITEIKSDNQWSVETVKSLDNVPSDVLLWRNGSYKVKNA